MLTAAGSRKDYSMTEYANVIYPKDEKNTYPQKLCNYISKTFFKTIEVQAEKCKILDIGCCKGTALKSFNKSGNFELYGIDIRDENVEGINFKACNLEKESIPYPDDYFDYIYSKSVLEHVVNTDNFLSEALRVLKPNGRVVFLTPDWISQYKFFWDDYTHVKPFTRKSLRDAMLIHGYDQVDCNHFYQLPFIWKYPFLKFIPWVISLLPDFLKWKTREQRNTKDRKLIRFSKEKMLLVSATKPREKK
jgi:SAM-dependent methyltransferase